MDDRGRPLSNEDSVRESLLGLLKATGIVGGLSAAPVNQSSLAGYGTAADYQHAAGYGAAVAASQYGPTGTVGGTVSQYGGQPVAAQYAGNSGTSQYASQITGSSQYASSISTTPYAVDRERDRVGQPSVAGGQAAVDKNSDHSLSYKGYDVGGHSSGAMMRSGQSGVSQTPPIQSSSQQQQNRAPRDSPQGRQTQGGMSSYGSRMTVKEENGMDYSLPQQQQQPGLRYAAHDPLSSQQYQSSMSQGQRSGMGGQAADQRGQGPPGGGGAQQSGYGSNGTGPGGSYMQRQMSSQQSQPQQPSYSSGRR